MRIDLEKISATTTFLIIALAFIAFSFAIFGSPVFAASNVSTDCTSPVAPTGISSSIFNSTFTLQVIGATGTTVSYNQNTILNLAGCWSYGGFRAHASGNYQPQNYGNYTGIPVLTLVNLVGGISPGQTVTATSGTDGYQVTYTYSEVVSGTGWGSEYSTSVCDTPNACSSSSSAVASPVPMYLVLAYLWNGSAISAYSCTGGSPPCASGPTTAGNGPLRTVTLSSSPGYLLSAGGPWNKGVATIKVNPVPPGVPEFNLGSAVLSGTLLAVVLGFFAMFAVRRSYLGRLRQ